MGRLFLTTAFLALTTHLTWAESLSKDADQDLESQLFSLDMSKDGNTPSSGDVKLASFDKELMELFSDEESLSQTQKAPSKLQKVADQTDQNSMQNMQQTSAPNPSQAASSQNQLQAQVTNHYKIHPYYAFPDKEMRLYAAIDYLFWTLSEPGLFYGISKSHQYLNEPAMNFPQGGSYATGTLGKIEKQTFDWSSGVRGSLGYQFKNSNWNLSADYTFFNTSNSTTTYRPNTAYGYLAGLNFYQSTNIMAQSAKTHITFKYQNAKVMLGTPWVNFKPARVQLLFGAHATWVDQNWRVDFNPYTAPNGSTQYNTKTNSSWGVGFNTTGKFDAHFGKGFSFGVSGFAAVLLGQQSLTSYSQSIPGALIPNAAYSDYYQDPSYQFMSQFMLSPQFAWSRVFRSCAIRIEAAYEFNALLNMLDLYRDNNTTSDPQSNKLITVQNNSLYLHGLTLKFGAGF